MTPGRGTLALGALATATLATVVLVELRRARRSGSEDAVADVARVAREGYRDVPTFENALFNLLTSFATTFLLARMITYRLREKARVEIKLRRGAGTGKLVRVIERGVRSGSRYHRIRLRPTHLRRGRYVVRIFVQGASGKRQVAQLAARRR